MLNYHEIIHMLHNNKLKQIYLSTAIRSFATAIVGLFVPLYLHHDLGYSFQQTILYYVSMSLFFAVFTPIAAKFSSKYGLKHSILVSIPFYILTLVALHLLKFYPIPLILIGLIGGVSVAFYWMGMNLLFFLNSDQDHRGAEVGKNMAFRIVGISAGPLLGGLIISYFGFLAAYITSGVLFLLSGLILFLSSEDHIKYHFKFKQIINKDHWKDSLFFMGRGAEVMSNGVIWRLFIFFILGSYLSLGVVGTILSGVSAILVIIVGKISDKKDKRKMVRTSSIFETLAWIFRSLVQTTTHIYIATIFASIVNGIRKSPLMALEFDKAKDEAASYFVSREISMCLGRMLVLMIALMINMKTSLIFQGLVVLLSFIF